MQILTGLHTCDECGKKSMHVVSMGGDHNEYMMDVCPTCLQSALDALQEADDQALELYVDGLRHEVEMEDEECQKS